MTFTIRGCAGFGFVSISKCERNEPRHDEDTALDVRMRGERTERGAAGVPAEMVQLVAGVRELDSADPFRSWRRRIGIDDREPIGNTVARLRSASRHRRGLSGGAFHRVLWGSVKCGVGLQLHGGGYSVLLT